MPVGCPWKPEGLVGYSRDALWQLVIHCCLNRSMAIKSLKAKPLDCLLKPFKGRLKALEKSLKALQKA